MLRLLTSGGLSFDFSSFFVRSLPPHMEHGWVFHEECEEDVGDILFQVKKRIVVDIVDLIC